MSKYTLSCPHWEYILERPLTENEKLIIEDAIRENTINAKIAHLYPRVLADKLYIKTLTENDGNCLFQSVCSSGIIDCSIEDLKKSAYNMFVFFKNKKNFIPDQEMSLEELFQIRNEIEFVYCNNTAKLYKYTYDAMCEDLMTDGGWCRIETELLLTMLSVVLNIRFKIYHDNGHITEINCTKRPNTRTIYLAHIDEWHYLPLVHGDPVYDCPRYTDARDIFVEWVDNIYMHASPQDDDSDDFQIIQHNPGPCRRDKS